MSIGVTQSFICKRCGMKLTSMAKRQDKANAKRQEQKKSTRIKH